MKNLPQLRTAAPRKAVLAPLFLASLLSLSAQETTTPSNDSADKVVDLPQFNVNADQDKRGYQSTDMFGANRMVVPIDKMDGSAFVINQALLQDLSPRYLADAVKYVAGVEQPRYYSSYDQIVIRGNNAGTNLIDGFGVRGLAYIPLALVQQVEVIKGAQGILYGSVSGGGLLNTVRKQPQLHASSEITAEAGSYGYYGASIDVTGPLSAVPNTAYRFISSLKRGGGRQDNLATDSPEDVISGSAKFAIPSGGSITVFADYVDREVSFADQVTSGDPTTGYFDEAYSKKFSSYPSLRTDTTDERVAVVAEKMIGPLASRLSYQYLDSVWHDDALFPINNTITPDPLWARYRHNATISHGLFYDGVMKFNLLKVLNIVNFGYAYQKDTISAIELDNYGPNFDYGNSNYSNPSRAAVKFNLLSPHNTKVSDNVGTSTSNAYYANVRASIFDDRFSIIGGVRKESYSKFTLNNLNPSASRPGKDSSPTLWRGGVVAEITKDLNAYVSYGETYSINTSVAYIPPGSTVGINDYLPDPTSSNLEGGIHWTLWNKRVVFGATYYELSQTGLTRGGNSSFQPIIGLPDNTNKGYEFQLTAALTDDWFVIASATKAKITDVGGARTPDFAEDLANMWTKYRFSEGSVKGLGLGVGFNFYGDKVPVAQPSGTAGTATGYMIPSEVTWDAAISYERGNWAFQLNGRNLADNVFVTRFDGSNLSVWFSKGREINFSTRYKW